MSVIYVDHPRVLAAAIQTIPECWPQTYRPSPSVGCQPYRPPQVLAVRHTDHPRVLSVRPPRVLAASHTDHPRVLAAAIQTIPECWLPAIQTIPECWLPAIYVDHPRVLAAAIQTTLSVGCQSYRPSSNVGCSHTDHP